MKIQQLDLIAFGPFTGLSLDLSAGNAGLHIIFGPNESGKSSSLRALRQLLYGIPQQSTDNFLHSHANMRIGGRLLHADGSVLSLVRRKGRSNTLRDAVDLNPVADAEFERFLDGLKQSTFESMFGIDHGELVAGGQALCKGKGELGQILFASGAGVADVRTIAEKLAQEAEALFLPAGSKPAINSALSQLKDAQRALKDVEVPGSEWEKHHDALHEFEKKRIVLEEELKNKGQTIARLQRWKEALPLAAGRKELLRTLEDLTGAVCLPEDFGEKSRQLQLDLRRTVTEEQNTSKEIEQLSEQLAIINIPEGLLEQATVIEDLHQQLGSHQKAMVDRSGLLNDINRLEADIMTGLKSLGHSPAIESCQSLHITVSDRARIRDLASDKAGLQAQCSHAQSRLGQLKLSLENTHRQLDALKDTPDVGRLQPAVKRIVQMGALDTQLKNAAARHEVADGQLFSDGQRLCIGDNLGLLAIVKNKDWEKLDSLPVPAPETIELFHERTAEVRQSLDNLQKTLKQEGKDLQLAAQQLEQFQLEMDIPTEDDLVFSRRRRDRGWQLIRRAWREGAPEPQEVANFVGVTGVEQDLCAAYEQSVATSDSLADRLRREADHVARKASLMADMSRHNKRLEELRQEIDSNQSQLEHVQKDWVKLWGAAGISASYPAEMRAWSQRFQDVRKQVAVVREARIHLKDLQESIAQCKQELGSVLLGLAEPPVLEGESLSGLIERCQMIIDTASSVKTQRERLILDLEKLQADRSKAEDELKSAQKALEDWNFRWAAALQPLSLEPNTTPSQANAVLDTLDRLLKDFFELQDLHHRVNGIERDGKEFASNVQKLVNKVAVDLLDFPPPQAAAELNSRLGKMRAAKERFDVLTREKERRLEALEASRFKCRESKDKLSMMCQEAGCQSYESLGIAFERSTALRRALSERAALELHLLRVSGGAALEEFVQEVLALAPDSIEPDICRLTEEIAQCQNERGELDQNIGRQQAELRRIDGGAQAAETAEQVQMLFSQIAADSEQYARARLAHFILNRGIERYREKNQSPVLKRASEIFAQLTLRSFAGLKEDYNDKGEPILVGVRAGSGQLVALEGMSDGTCDQVYFALRLASLEIYLRHNQAIPFIVDDILVNFDDQRSAAALKILGDLSGLTQIIFFTHHAHLVELAERTLKQDIVFVHQLPGVRVLTATAAV